MTWMLLFVATGFGLLGLLVAVFSRMGTHFPSDVDPAANAVWFRGEAALSSQRVGRRIFSREDFDFVLREAPWLRKELLRERRALALSWLAQRRNSVRCILQVYPAAARASKNLVPANELKLALNYFAFIVICAVAEGVIWLRGPFTASRMISSIIVVGDRMRSFSEGSLKTLDPALLERLQGRELNFRV